MSYQDRASLQKRISGLEMEIARLNAHKQSMAEHIVWMIEASETMIATCKILMKGVSFEEPPTPTPETK